MHVALIIIIIISMYAVVVFASYNILYITGNHIKQRKYINALMILWLHSCLSREWVWSFSIENISTISGDSTLATVQIYIAEYPGNLTE